MSYSVWPLRFSAKPQAMIDFFVALGLNQTVSHSSGTYATFAGRSGGLGVHDIATAAGTPTSGHTALNVVTADLEAAAEQLRSAGLQVLVWDETYGKQGAITSPSGVIIGLNERTQEDLYGGYELHDQPVAASMDIVAISTVADPEREADFFARLGFGAIEPGEGYLPLIAGRGTGVIALRRSTTAASAPTTHDQFAPHDQSGPPYLVALGVETSEPLDALAERLRAGGYAAQAAEDETGIWVRVTDPDGEPLEVRPTR